jgi:hypothetical protein
MQNSGLSAHHAARVLMADNRRNYRHLLPAHFKSTGTTLRVVAVGVHAFGASMLNRDTQR